MKKVREGSLKIFRERKTQKGEKTSYNRTEWKCEELSCQNYDWGTKSKHANEVLPCKRKLLNGGITDIIQLGLKGDWICL